MATKHPRLNVVMNEELMKTLNFIASHEEKSLSVIAKELIEESLEKREDFYLSAMAMKREENAKEYVAHEDAWTD